MIYNLQITPWKEQSCLSLTALNTKSFLMFVGIWAEVEKQQLTGYIWFALLHIPYQNIVRLVSLQTPEA